MSSPDQPLTALAFCWRIERADGAGLALTTHDRAFTRDRVTYRADPGLIPAAVERRGGLDAVSAEVSGAVTADGLTEHDLALGRWDGARVRLSAFDWSDERAGEMRLAGGELGEVSIGRDGFSAELRGAAAKLEQPVCPATSPECRATFGDKKCRVDLAGRTASAVVVQASGTQLTLDRAIGDGKLFGRLRFMSGANCGTDTAVLAVDGAGIRMRDAPRAAVEPGCRVEVRDGCDKRLATCAGRFANAINFRGEPHLPGNDLLTRYPGA